MSKTTAVRAMSSTHLSHTLGLRFIISTSLCRYTIMMTLHFLRSNVYSVFLDANFFCAGVCVPCLGKFPR